MSYVASVLAGLASTISWSARFAKNFSLLIWVGGNIANIEIGMMPVQLKVIWWFCQSTNMVPTLMSSDSGISGTPKSIILQTPNTKCSKTMTKRSLSAKMCLFVWFRFWQSNKIWKRFFPIITSVQVWNSLRGHGTLWKNICIAGKEAFVKPFFKFDL